MDTSINITHYRGNPWNRRCRRGIGILLVGILLMCLLSACAIPIAVQAAEVETSQEENYVAADMPNRITESSDDSAANEDNITQLTLVQEENVADDTPTVVNAMDTTWQEDYDYELYKAINTIVIRRYLHSGKPDRPTELTIERTATIDGVTCRTLVADGVFVNAYYIRKVTFENGVGVYGNSLSSMFRNCLNLEEVDLGTLDTTGVTYMNMMFMNCERLRRLDLSMFNTAGVTSMEQMFQNCYHLEDLNVSGWITTSCSNMWHLFADCMSLKSLDLSSWSTRRMSGIQIAGMFSVGLEELTIGPEFYTRNGGSGSAVVERGIGLLGNWTDGTAVCSADQLQSRWQNGSAAGTYRRVSLGGDRSEEMSRNQEVLTLPVGYKGTEELTTADMDDETQRNGQISSTESEANGQLVKTAAWISQDAGTAEIDLEYAVPSQGGARAVYAFGTCNMHGFGADVAIIQMMELLDQYDYVDAMTTESQFWKYFDKSQDFLATSRELTFTLSAADGREATYNRLVTLFTPDHASLENYNIIHQDSHASGVMLLPYLMDYMRDHDPAAIYVSFDGSRAFSYDGSTGHRASAIPPLYGTTSGAASLARGYDDLILDADIMQKLADYQADGRYYVCIVDPVKFKLDGYETAYYYPAGRNEELEHDSRLLCYASIALASPYYYVHQNADLRAYLEAGTIQPFNHFRTVGKAFINYGESFIRQGVQYISAPLTITDTLEDGLVVDEDNIDVTITLDGEPIRNAQETAVTVDGQTVRIYLPEVSIGEVVSVRIPVGLAPDAVGFRSENEGFRDTNVGSAEAVTAAGNTVVVDSPRLFKRAYAITTEVVHGTITGSERDIRKGEERTITYAPENGYHLVSVTVDDALAETREYESSYVFSNITGDHTIRVVYEADEEPEEPKETPEEPKETPEEPEETPEEPEETPEEPEEAPEEPEETPAEPDETTAVTHKETDHKSHTTDCHTAGHETVREKVIVREPVVPTTLQIEEPAMATQTSTVPVAGSDAPMSTGDDSHMMLWLMAAVVSTLGILGWIVRETRRLYE